MPLYFFCNEEQGDGDFQAMRRGVKIRFEFVIRNAIYPAFMRCLRKRLIRKCFRDARCCSKVVGVWVVRRRSRERSSELVVFDITNNFDNEFPCLDLMQVVVAQ